MITSSNIWLPCQSLRYNCEFNSHGFIGGDTRTWQDGTTKTLSQKKKTSNGKRFIVVHAGSRNGFLEDAGLLFSTKNKSADYHDNMNSGNFEKWFQDSVLQRLEEPTIIVLDNAPYHTRTEEKWPAGSWKKQDIKDWLDEKKIAHAPDLMKADLLEIVQSQKKPDKRYVIDILANQAGHKVLRLPPYHCQFNPIEMVWGIAKSYYDKQIAFTSGSDEDVFRVWEEALKSVDSTKWANCVDKVNKDIRAALEREHLIDDVRPLVITTGNDSSDDGSDDDVDDESNEDSWEELDV